MALLTQWTWVWTNSGRQWKTEKCGVLQLMGLQRIGHDLANEQQQHKWGKSKILKKFKSNAKENRNLKDMKKTQLLNIFFLKIKNLQCVTNSFSKTVSGLKIGTKELYVLNYLLNVLCLKIFFRKLKYKTKSKNVKCPQQNRLLDSQVPIWKNMNTCQPSSQSQVFL